MRSSVDASNAARRRALSPALGCFPKALIACSRTYVCLVPSNDAASKTLATAVGKLFGPAKETHQLQLNERLNIHVR